MIPACDDTMAAVRAEDFNRAEKLLAACTEANAAPLEVLLMIAALHQSRRDEARDLARAASRLARERR